MVLLFLFFLISLRFGFILYFPFFSNSEKDRSGQLSVFILWSNIVVIYLLMCNIRQTYSWVIPLPPSFSLFSGTSFVTETQSLLIRVPALLTLCAILPETAERPVGFSMGSVISFIYFFVSAMSFCCLIPLFVVYRATIGGLMVKLANKHFVNQPSKPRLAGFVCCLVCKKVYARITRPLRPFEG